MAYIDRKQKDYILKLLSIFPVVGIIGGRQVGKTTLIKLLQQKIEKPSIYIDLESDADALKLRMPELYLKQHLDKCILIPKTTIY